MRFGNFALSLRGTSITNAILAVLFPAIVRASATETKPLSIPFSSLFFGNDGYWSAAQIRLNPQQWLSVFPSTLRSETWVIGSDGCDGTLTCDTLRGGIFYSNISSTFVSLGNWDLGYSPLTGRTDYAYYGLDNLTLTDQVTLEDQILAVVNSSSSYLGSLGLGVKETGFRNDLNYRSVISTLVQNSSLIPSHSYGYTAGAHYRQKTVSGSLTLGGYDATRFTPNSISFTLGQGYTPGVAIVGLTISSSSASVDIPPNWSNNPLSVLQPSQSVLYTIDSSTPFLWMPGNICDSIASALNLTYDNDINLYTFMNTSAPQLLIDWGLSFTFTIADSANSDQSLQLTLPYDAFNLQLSSSFPGLVQESTTGRVNYFPLRRANSSDQYTIGRAFLQETYLTVDYERNLFTLSQAVFNDGSPSIPNIVPIDRPDDSTWPGPKVTFVPSGLSAGSKVGIAIGVLTIVIGAALLLWFSFRRRRTSRQQDPNEKKTGDGKKDFRSFFNRPLGTRPLATELSGDKRYPEEMQADVSNTRFEMSANGLVEMSAGEVSPSFFTAHGDNTISRNDPRNPAELTSPASQGRYSTDKGQFQVRITERPVTPVPAYSLSPNSTTQQPQNSDSVSPYSPTSQSNPFASSSSSPGTADVSPVTRWFSDRSPDTSSPTVSSNTGELLTKTASQEVSPVRSNPTVSQLQQTPQVQPSGNRNSSGSHLLPLPQDDSLSRSISRNSRFREELMDDGDTRADRWEANRRPSVARSRFSWED